MQKPRLVIMPGMFTFGILNYFRFTFRAEPHLPSHRKGNTDSSPCGTLSKLPLEIRIMVYSRVLLYEGPFIKQPHKFLGRHRSIMTEDSKYVEAIDAALLRASKAIYHESLHILYGKNDFHFRKPSDLTEFAHAGLGITPFGFYSFTHNPSSVVNDAPCGRLTMIRCMYLELTSKRYGDCRENIWSFWSDIFEPPEKQNQLVEFPALERLRLDLRDWKLDGGNASKVRVCYDFLQF